MKKSAATQLPGGFQQVGAEALFGRRQTAVVLDFDRGEHVQGSWVVTEGLPASAPFLILVPEDAVETLTVMGHTLHRTTYDGAPMYEWSVGGAALHLNLGPTGDGAPGTPLSEEELELVVSGATVASEPQWQAWIDWQGSEPDQGPTATTSTLVAGDVVPSVDAGLVRAVPGPLPAGARVGSITGDTSANLAGRYVGRAKWGRVEDGKITSALLASFSGFAEPTGQRQVRDDHVRKPGSTTAPRWPRFTSWISMAVGC